MPEKITVYEKSACTTCRSLAKLLRANGIEYERIDYYIEPLSEEKLRELLEKLDLTPFQVLRKNEPIYKELFTGERVPTDEIIRLIIENPNLLQRPIVEVGSRAVLARPIEKALELINE